MSLQQGISRKSDRTNRVRGSAAGEEENKRSSQTRMRTARPFTFSNAANDLFLGLFSALSPPGLDTTGETDEGTTRVSRSVGQTDAAARRAAPPPPPRGTNACEPANSALRYVRSAPVKRAPGLSHALPTRGRGQAGLAGSPRIVVEKQQHRHADRQQSMRMRHPHRTTVAGSGDWTRTCLRLALHAGTLRYSH